MSSAPKLRTLLALAWPIIISRATQAVDGLADTLMVAPLGADALAAASTGAIDTFVAFMLPLGTVFIVQSFAAQHAGRGEPGVARRFAWYGLAIAAFTQVVAMLAVPTLPHVFAAMPYEPGVRDLLVTYVAWRLGSGGAAIGIEALNAYYGGLGRTRPGMVANVVLTALNLFFNAVFIWGWFGAPAMGVKGAALASTVATWIAFVAFFGWFLFEGRTLAKPALSVRELGRMLRFGVPSGFNYFFEFMAYVVFVNVVVAGLGTAALGAWNSVMTLSSVAFMPAFGIASAGAVLVGQAIGANRKDDVPGIVRLVLLSACTWQGLVGVACFAVPELVMRPFAQGADAELVLSIGVSMLLVSAAWQLFDATATTYGESLRAAGDTNFPMLARLVIAWGIFTPGAWYSVHHLGWGHVGTASWLVLYLALLAVAVAWRFRRGTWRTIELVEPSLG